jgi:hypothetical protein
MLIRSNITALRRFGIVMLAAIVTSAHCAPASAQICDINAFAEQCPSRDSSYATIRQDFILRQDGVVIEEASCTEPISQMNIADYTDALSVRQYLRAIYNLPITIPGEQVSLYQWLHAKIQGINIISSGLDSCCSTFDGKTYFNMRRAPDQSNKEYHRSPNGIIQAIGLILHERRHLDTGWGGHVSCCPVGKGACDQQYSTANLSPYGLQWWLTRGAIDNTIYVGYACAGSQKANDFLQWQIKSANGFRDRFCESPPPVTSGGGMVCDKVCLPKAPQSGGKQ